jgi:serine phosphatase RsbU (regulator of sigma subunit)
VLLGRPPRQLPDELVGPALGMLPGVVWGSRIVELGDTWRILLFSDGLVEGRVGAGPDRLGVDGMLRIANDFADYDDSGALVDHLIAEARRLHGGDLSDDIAVVVVRHEGRAG